MFKTILKYLNSNSRNIFYNKVEKNFFAETFNSKRIMATVAEAVKIARLAFNRNVTKDVNFRKEQLRAVYRLLSENEEAFVDALKKDFNKPRNEVVMNELEVAKNDLVYQLENIDEYVKPVPAAKSGFAVYDEPFIKYEPYGVALIIGAWNYPVQLLFAPLVGAITAGNCAILKPSELPKNTEQLIADLIPKYLDNECYHVFTGGPNETTEILRERYDYIFFTGSPMVGRIVHQAAAQHLTPCTLELGGKSPLWIDESTPDFEVACRRLLWAKFINTGQTCVAPDYIITTPKVQQTFISYALRVLEEFFGTDPKKSDSLCRIINDRNFERVSNLLATTKGEIICGGETDASERYIAPTILANVLPDDPIMQDEIFGPLLPILVVNDVDEAIDYIKANEKPLALYVFSTKKDIINRFLEETSSGVVCGNDAIINLLLESLPFGGVGNSGMGLYHGRYSFEIFSHPKATLIRSYNADIEELTKNRYPPFTPEKTEIMKNLVKKELPP